MSPLARPWLPIGRDIRRGAAPPRRGEPRRGTSASAAEQGRRYVYADSVVVCGPMKTEPGTSDVLANPRFLVEVISKSTETYDRGEKWEAYQRLASLTDYLLVAQASVRVEHFQREADGSWRYRVKKVGDTVTLANGATLSIDAIYEDAFALDAD
jgi:Uma2 family endonuclease